MKGAVTLGLVLASVIVSQLFIFSFRHIPLTGLGRGQEPLYALVGGAALALSAPTVPLLVLYLAVLFTAGKAGSKSARDDGVTLLPAGLFLLVFVIAFVITISGKPSLIANSVYMGKWIINIIGGLFVAFYGLKAFAEKFTVGTGIKGKRRRTLVMAVGPRPGNRAFSFSSSRSVLRFGLFLHREGGRFLPPPSLRGLFWAGAQRKSCVGEKGKQKSYRTKEKGD